MRQRQVPRHITTLVTDEDPGIRKLISRILMGSGHRVHEALSCEEACRALSRLEPHLLVLSLDTADCPGSKAIALLRNETEAPILALSSRDDEATVLDALNGGADDFLVKPFRSREFLARAGNVLRRPVQRRGTRPIFVEGALKVDIVYRRVWVGDTEIHLGPKSYELLELLIENAGRVVSHRKLLTHLWGTDLIDRAPYLRRVVSELRCAIGADPANRQLITTEPRIGYRLTRTSKRRRA
jgi:two-component system KDP operon response regulator KdpE